MKKQIFYDKFNITHDDFALITFHPETIAKDKNELFAFEMRKALIKISAKLFLVVTLPNADTMGSIYRKEMHLIKKKFPKRIVLIENFGEDNYFNAMYYAKLLIGNSSSGIIEAASFGKYVINVGDRQKGREHSENLINTSYNHKKIVDSVEKALKLGTYSGHNVYLKKGSINLIIESIKKYYETI